VITEIKLDFN